MRRAAAALAFAAALAATSHGQPAPSADAIVNSLGMRMVSVPAGTFTMGSPPGAPMRQDEETPRRVTLTRAFRLSATEVTQEQWNALMVSNRSPVQGGELPVTAVSWREAQEFCARLSAREGTRYRLPTEAEWEHACRAGADGPAPSTLEAYAWYAENADGAPHPVGARTPNAWGLFDLLGNAAEWTQDAYAPYPRSESETDPLGPATGTSRVVRGGSYRSFKPALRCAARASTPEAHQQPHVGFRVALD